jgi:hypothetical protein
MNLRLLAVSLLTAASSLVVTPGPARAQDADLTGTWQVTITTGQAQGRTAPLVLRRDGKNIVGTITTPQGDQTIEAAAAAKTVTLWFSVKTQTGLTNVTMKGTVDGDVMNGTIDFGSGQGQWTAKRGAVAGGQSDARTDVSGAWAFQVEFSGGSGTPTMTFKQDGEKLTGQYSGQLGEAPLTGTIKGNAIEFAIDVDVQGTAAHITYSGTVDKDSMKGTVKLGDFGEGTFTAKKKP